MWAGVYFSFLKSLANAIYRLQALDFHSGIPDWWSAEYLLPLLILRLESFRIEGGWRKIPVLT
jgi:hypothetical protein